MVANQHPAILNPLQRFRQAGAILRGTSRASNPAWYESALDLDLQLHLRVDGSAVESFLYDRKVKAWSPGPVFDEACATDPALIPAFAAQVLSTARGAGASSIGVVLHLADEFATSELKPELDGYRDFCQYRENEATLRGNKVSREDWLASKRRQVWLCIRRRQDERRRSGSRYSATDPILRYSY